MIVNKRILLIYFLSVTHWNMTKNFWVTPGINLVLYSLYGKLDLHNKSLKLCYHSFNRTVSFRSEFILLLSRKCFTPVISSLYVIAYMTIYLFNYSYYSISWHYYHYRMSRHMLSLSLCHLSLWFLIFKWSDWTFQRQSNSIWSLTLGLLLFQ